MVCSRSSSDALTAGSSVLKSSQLVLGTDLIRKRRSDLAVHAGQCGHAWDPSAVTGYDRSVPRYLIVRSFEVGEAEMPGVGRRSREIVENDLPEITWELCHVVIDELGLVRTYCI
jgi:hypothetical protein